MCIRDRLAELACKLVYMKDEEIRSLLTNRITSEEITLEYPSISENTLLALVCSSNLSGSLLDGI